MLGMKYLPCLLLLLSPVFVSASHNDKENLGDDIVEEFAVPVLFGVDISNVRSDFGDPRGGGTRLHEGQDFLVPKGTPVVSPTKAIVTRVGTWESAGKHVYTANPGGETFAYLHLDEWADIEVGDRLDVGDYIGTVGDTGNAAPGSYHLHFETIDKHDVANDPYPRMTKEFSLEDKMDFLDDIFRDRRDDAEYAQLLLNAFPEVFKQAVDEDIDLPRAIEKLMDYEPEEEVPTVDRDVLMQQIAQLRLQLQILLLKQRILQLQSGV